MRALVLATVVICGTASCTAPSAPLSGPEYLKSLENSHTLDSKAEKVCTKDAGTPVEKPVVAADSTLNFVRKLQLPGYAARMGDSDLTGKKQGYAAICLFKTTNYGKPVTVWGYYLPDGDSGFIDAG